jgi:hypothetical protein
MNKSKEWKDADNNTYYFFNKEDGLIVGQVHNVTHTKIWIAKIILNYNEDKYIGQYITCDFAKSAIERYWEIQDRTLIE